MPSILTKTGKALCKKNSLGASVRADRERSRLKPIEKTEEELVITAQAAPPGTLFEFCNATSAFELHSWQNLYCGLLERLRTERGIRILVHGPPQYGKTFVTSQRLPAYLCGWDPLHRVGVATYNETHSGNQTAVCRDIMASKEYAEWFPDSAVPKKASEKEFSTPARLALHDGQPSVVALGLLSGSVGKGFDTLVIDDPYASADAARSEATNGAVKRWWSTSIKPRIFPHTNVVVMFHRYHDDDLAAWLEKEGGFEVYRFPAIADGNDKAGIDLTIAHGLRKIGEPLSSMRTLQDLLALQAADEFTFASQFQGIPRPASGGMIRVAKLGDRPATDIVARCRAWDIASTPGAGDYTAGVREAKGLEGGFFFEDAVFVQGGPDEVDDLIVDTARADGRGVKIRLARDPGSAGVRDAARIARLLAGYDVEIVTVTGSKEIRARPMAAQINAGNFNIPDSFGRIVMTGPYRGLDTRDALIKMLQGFPFGAAKKDGVDAAADAFSDLAKINLPDGKSKSGPPVLPVVSGANRSGLPRAPGKSGGSIFVGGGKKR